MKTVTLKEIAGKLNISPTAVSLALSDNSKKRRISKDLAFKIRQTAREMGYLPDLGARRLRDRGHQHLVIAIISSYEAPIALVGNILYETEKYMKLQCPEAIKVSFVVEYYHAGKLAEISCFESQPHFHGAIISNTLPADDKFLSKTQLSFPVVLIGRNIPEYSSITSEANAGGDKAAKVLVEAGCKKLAVLQPSHLTQTTKARVDSFMRISRKLTNEKSAEIIVDSIDEQAGFNGVMNYLQQGKKLDGLFLISDAFGLGVYSALKKYKLRIPQDIKIVGCDMMPFTAFMDPALTTIAVPQQTMRREVAHLMFRMLMGEVKDRVQMVFDNEIFLRESTGH